MNDNPQSISSLLARREYAAAVPLLRVESEKYPSNARIRLQLADALAGAGMFEEAVEAYTRTAAHYKNEGLTVQAIAIEKKLEKITALLEQRQAERESAEPTFKDPAPRSPLFENMTDDERAAVVEQMVLETFDEDEIVIREGDLGSSLYVIVSGEVKVFGKNPRGMPVYLADLKEGDFFGEVSVLTGKPRTATITAATRSELLRLDREKLEVIIATHPRVREILEAFYQKRAKHTVDAMVDSIRKRG
jgi:CRP-like cAMP-binding protein